MLFYDKGFSLDTASPIKLNGYYQIRQIFGNYTTNGKDYYPHDPTYGYLQFFNDGFCKIGWWNGFFESPQEITKEIEANKAFGFWGIFKIKKDTLYIEYLYNPSSPGVAPFEDRNTLIGLINGNEINVLEHNNTLYSFPNVPRDSLTSSCIGRFVKIKTDYSKMENYLKENISNYQ